MFFPRFFMVLFAAFVFQLHAQAWAVEVWKPWEKNLASTKSYANPYANVTVSVTYTSPSGKPITGYAFWDGGNTFRLRFMFPEPGIWSWTTSSSDTTNNGLHNQAGTVTVEPYSGDNTLYTNGYLKVSDNAQYLAYDNGIPFLWLGDTAWAAPIAATQQEWEAYVDKRKAQSFNVIQVHAGRGWIKRNTDRNGNSPFIGSGSGLKWNPTYWQGVEKKIQYANEQGLLVLFAAIGMPGPGFPEDDERQVSLFSRNIAARMNAFFVVYSPVADDIPTALADAAGAMLAASAPRHLVTAHPRYQLPAAQTFHDKAYIDFAGLQSGNGWTHDSYAKEAKEHFSPVVASQNAIDWTLSLYRQLPLKPVINMEVVYDSMRLQAMDAAYYLQPYPTRLPRSTAYLAMLSGSRGVTYGAGGVWNWGNPVSNTSAGWTLEAALDQPSGTQMQYLFGLFSGLEWWNLVPSHHLIQNQAADPVHRMVLARTQDGRLAVAYLPDNAQITLDMSAFTGTVTARWFNPVTNLSAPVSTPVANGGIYTFVKPPSWDDAVLILTAIEQSAGG